MKAQSRTSRSFAAVDRWRFTYTGAEQQLVAANIVILHDSMLQFLLSKGLGQPVGIRLVTCMQLPLTRPGRQMCAYAGALYVPPAAPAPHLHSNPEDRHVQANESNSPADESTPEPCEVYQV